MAHHALHVAGTPCCLRIAKQTQALVEQEMGRVYGADSVEAVVPVYNTNTLDAAAVRYWQLAGQFEGGAVAGWGVSGGSRVQGRLQAIWSCLVAAMCFVNPMQAAA